MSPPQSRLPFPLASARPHGFCLLQGGQAPCYVQRPASAAPPRRLARFRVQWVFSFLLTSRLVGVGQPCFAVCYKRVSDTINTCRAWVSYGRSQDCPQPVFVGSAIIVMTVFLNYYPHRLT